MLSIQSRLSIGLLSSLVSIFLILWVVVSHQIHLRFEEYTAMRLHHDIDTLIGATRIDSENRLQIDLKRVDNIYKRPFSGHYYSITYQDQELRSRSLWDQKLKHQEPPLGKFIHFHQNGPQDLPLIVVSGRFNKKGQMLTISVGEDLTLLTESIQYFKKLFAGLTAVTLLVLLATQSYILKQGLKPLEEIRNELKQLEQGKITALSGNIPKEIQPLANEINHLLNIMEKRLTRSRAALSDLSHAIKKPLTIAYQLLDQSLKNDEQSNNPTHVQNHANKIREQINRIRQLSDGTLKRARLAGKVHSGRLFNFNREIQLLLKTLEAMYPQKTLYVEYPVPVLLEKPLEREDMLELLGNILDNAYKWAQKSIHITIDINKYRQLYLCIEDDGPGVDLSALKELPQRGKRLDETIHGHGFGLAIAADIVDDYDGQLSFSRSSTLGGFKVTIEIP